MMRLDILADTHDELARTQRAVSLLLDAGSEALIHCGDLFTIALLDLESGGLRFLRVPE